MEPACKCPVLKFTEPVALRTYYLFSTGLLVLESVVKISSFVGSFFISVLYRNKSALMKAWIDAHTMDAWISIKLVYFSMNGIIRPRKAAQKIDCQNNQSVNDLSTFTFDIISKATAFEKLGMSMQLVINSVKEFFSMIISGALHVSALIGKVVHGNKSCFEKISFHEFYLLSGHVSYCFGSMEGVFNPVKAHYSMLAPEMTFGDRKCI